MFLICFPQGFKFVARFKNRDKNCHFFLLQRIFGYYTYQGFFFALHCMKFYRICSKIRTMLGRRWRLKRDILKYCKHLREAAINWLPYLILEACLRTFEVPMKRKLSLSYLKKVLKWQINILCSFSFPCFVFDIFQFVWYAN